MHHTMLFRQHRDLCIRKMHMELPQIRTPNNENDVDGNIYHKRVNILVLILFKQYISVLVRLSNVELKVQDDDQTVFKILKSSINIFLGVHVRNPKKYEQMSHLRANLFRFDKNQKRFPTLPREPTLINSNLEKNRDLAPV